MEILYGVAIPLLGSSKEYETINTKSQMFHSVRSGNIYNRIWKQPICPSADDLLKMWYIHGLLYSHERGWSAIIFNKKEEILKNEVQQSPSEWSKQELDIYIVNNSVI